MKKILNIFLIIFNIIVLFLIINIIKNKNKEFFNNFDKYTLLLGEHFNIIDNKKINCQIEKDMLINCYKENCGDKNKLEELENKLNECINLENNIN